MANSLIHIGSDCLITLDALTDNVDGSYVNDATASADLTLASDDTAIDDFSLDYVADSDGKYQGVIAASVTATLDVDNVYAVRMTATVDASTYYAVLFMTAKAKEFH